MSQPPPPQTHPPRLHNKIAIITGSSSGLGRAIALAYASHGTRLIVCADLTPDAPSSDSASSDPHVPDDNDPHSADAQKPTHELICARYGVDKAVFCRTDVGDAGSVEGCVGMAVERGGRLDMWVFFFFFWGFSWFLVWFFCTVFFLFKCEGKERGGRGSRYRKADSPGGQNGQQRRRGIRSRTKTHPSHDRGFLGHNHVSTFSKHQTISPPSPLRSLLKPNPPLNTAASTSAASS